MLPEFISKEPLAPAVAARDTQWLLLARLVVLYESQLEFTRDDLYDPDDPNADRMLFFLNAWIEMITMLNEMARSLGQPDFYPFIMPRAVVRKLHFVTLVVNDART